MAEKPFDPVTATLLTIDSDREIALRKYAVEQAIQAVKGTGGKANNVCFVAGDIYRFLQTGTKPVMPDGWQPPKQ